MKKNVILAGLVAFPIVSVLLLLTGAWPQSQDSNLSSLGYVPNEVLVSFERDVNKYLIQGALDNLSGKIITYLGKEIFPVEWDPAIRRTWSFLLDPYLLHVRIPEHVSTAGAVDYFKNCPLAKYAEKNYLLSPTAVYANDTHFSKLWGLFNRGQTGGKTGADIDAPSAWNVFKGAASVVVAVIDTGVDYTHLDLETNIWTNPDEIPNNGLDDDNNGYVDDVHGWDFYDNDNDPMDAEYHGTHVSGILAAKGGNGQGVAGVNWSLQIMPLKVGCTPQGYLTTAAEIAAIDYATVNGALLSNNSYKQEGYSQATYEAISRAKNAGRLFIAASGNASNNNDAFPVYPGSYDLDNIISVLSTDHNDNLSSFSNYGSTSVDLGAPGGSGYPIDDNDIYSTKPTNNYGFLWGTSQAAPLVSGVAALVWGCRPDLSWAQVKNAILSSVDYQVSLTGKCISGGRLNAYRALCVNPPQWISAPSNLQGSGTCDSITLTWNDNSNNEQGFRIERKSGPYWNNLADVGPNSPYYMDSGLPCGQLFYYRVYAFNELGNSLYTQQIARRTTPCPYCGDGLELSAEPSSITGRQGDRIVYSYTLANHGDLDLISIRMEDDYFGVFGDQFALRRGETRSFTNSIILYKPLIIRAEVTASFVYEETLFVIKKTAKINMDIRD